MIMRREQAQILLANVEKLEHAMLQESQVPCPVTHHFGPGVYMREVMIPAGTLAIGHHQNFEHVSLLLKGRLTMLNDDGSISELMAPMIFPNWPAGRKISFCLEDMVWMNVYSTTETDIEKLEAHFLTKSQTFLETELIRSKAKKLQAAIDRTDFVAAMNELRINEAEFKATTEQSETNWIPYGSYKTKLGNSAIEGRGLFATSDIEVDEFIMPARANGVRTIGERFVNHSKNPNAKMIRGLGTDLDLIATRTIMGCHGGIDGEEITVDYREALKLSLELAREA